MVQSTQALIIIKYLLTNNGQYFGKLLYYAN